MKDRVDHELFAGGFLENFEGKAADQRAPELIDGEGKHLRMTLDQEDAGFDSAEKFLAETGLTTLIPPVGFRHLERGFRRMDHHFNHGPSEPAASPAPR
jgi:hypothetical protein